MEEAGTVTETGTGIETEVEIEIETGIETGIETETETGTGTATVTEIGTGTVADLQAVANALHVAKQDIGALAFAIVGRSRNLIYMSYGRARDCPEYGSR